MLRPVAKDRQEETEGAPRLGEAVPFPGAERAAGERYPRERPSGTGAPQRHGPSAELPHLDPTQPETVGRVLAHTRMKFGQDLRQVSQSLRIRHSYLEAIEADRHADLPGLAYAVGFVRSYADYLGLDSKALVQRYKEEAQGLNRKTQLVFPAPVQEAKVPTGAIVLIALILLGLAYGGWTYFSREAEPPPPAVAEPPSAGEAGPALASPASGESQGAAAGTVEAEGQTAPAGEAAPSDAATGFAATASGATESDTAGSDTTGSDTAGSDTPGSGATGSGATGSGATGSGATGSGATGQTAAEPAPLAGTSSGETASGQPDGSLGGPLTASIQDSTTPVPQPGATAGGEAQAAESQPAPAGQAEADLPQGVTPPPSVPAAPPSPATAQEAAVPPDADAPRVILHARQDSWVQIRNAEDEAILTQVLREGETYAVPNEPGLVLLTGNAGGLVIELDGKELPPLGAVGAVKRNVSLDPVALAN